MSNEDVSGFIHILHWFVWNVTHDFGIAVQSEECRRVFFGVLAQDQALRFDDDTHHFAWVSIIPSIAMSSRAESRDLVRQLPDRKRHPSRRGPSTTLRMTPSCVCYHGRDIPP